MARINIEDSLFRDSRWLKLLLKVGCEYKAIGLITRAWMLAQDTWLEHKSIPFDQWNKDLDVLVEVGFAEIEEKSFYIKGSKDAFAWLEQRSNSGKKNKRPLTTDERPLTGDEPLTLIPTLTLTPSLIQPQSLNLNTIAATTIVDRAPVKKSSTKKIKKDEPVKNSQLVKKAYSDSFKLKYGSDPVWSVAENVAANRLITAVGLDQAIMLAEYYPTYIDPWHVKLRHSFSQLVKNMHQIKTDMQNMKHLVDARLHEKNFDEKVDDYDHKKKVEHLRQQSELSRLAYELAVKDEPNLKDYQFDFEKFLEEKNIPANTPYHELKEILLNKNVKEISA
jgi:hypothetical protein